MLYIIYMMFTCLGCFKQYDNLESDEITFDEYNYSISYLIINSFNNIKIPNIKLFSLENIFKK